MTSDNEQSRQKLGDAEVRQIANVLAGTQRDIRVAVNHELLKEKLNDLLNTAGVPEKLDDTDHEQSFDAAITERELNRSKHNYLHKQFRDLANLAGRVERKLLLPELLPQLAARLHYEEVRETRSRRPRNGSSLEISGATLLHRLRDDLRLLKQAAEDLSAFEKSQIGSGRLHGELLDKLMLRLGDVYVETRGINGNVLELPKSPQSTFIRFCYEVLVHFFPLSSVDNEALSSRWRRLSA
jgi:hypothetical protein